MGRNSRRGPIPSPLGWLIDELDDFARRIRNLEAPTGSQLNNTAGRLQEVEAAVEERMVETAVDALITQRVSEALAAAFAGNVSITGALTVNGALAAASLSTGGALTVQGDVTLPGARSNAITSGDAVTAVLDASGRLGRTG